MNHIEVYVVYRPPARLRGSNSTRKTTKMDVTFRVNFLKGAGNVCTSFHFTPETILNILNKSNIIFWYHLHHLTSYISICIPKIFPHQHPPQLPSTIIHHSKVLARFSPRDRERDAFLVDSFSKVSRLCVSGMARCNSCRVSVKLWAVRRDCSKVLADFFLEKQRTNKEKLEVVVGLWLVRFDV